MRIDLDHEEDLFWGKLSPRENPVCWHPLEDHCIDVAQCALAMLEVPGIRSRMARLAGVDDLSIVHRERLAFVAGLHDLGKFNHGFQDRIRPGAASAGHVQEITQLLFATRLDVRAQLLDTIQARELSGWTEHPQMFLGLLLAAFAHHGGPVPKEGHAGVAHLWRDRGTRKPLDGIKKLMETLSRAFPCARTGDAEPLRAGSEFQHAFAGLVMLADWIGSDTQLFPYSEVDDSDRAAISAVSATGALREIGLDPVRLREVAGRRALTARDLFGFDQARPVQELIADLPLPEENSSSLVVLEAETGSGKTEAAWWWFARLLTANSVDGLYFALPTRAAATQLHQRLVDSKRRWSESDDVPKVILAVPGYLRADASDGKKLGSFDVLWDDDPGSLLRTRCWAAEGAKRYLAAAMAVGTIDQVLLSTLKVKHAHLRAFGLLRHLLVVDEVHASDPYMERILVEVLRHHLAAGGHALLMSATLGSSLRSKLEALTGGTPAELTLKEAIDLPYPRVSFQHADQRCGSSAASSTSVPKRVAMDTELSASDADRLARFTLKAARQGARVLIIRNTVGDCVSLQRQLEEIAGPEERHLLFRCRDQAAPHHSRFTAQDRRLLDREVEARFGKDARRTQGCVLCATQTVEQSLDIDADLMLTDLCPIDVLLQRIGRLHRHQRDDRPEAYATPRCRILSPKVSISELLEARKRPHGWGTVYDDLQILQATLDLVEERPVWSIPEDNRLLVERGTHPEALEQACPGPAWTAHRAQLLGSGMGQRRIARDSLVSWQVAFSDSLEPFPRRLEEQIKTRLGEEDLRIELPETLTTPFRTKTSELRVRAYLFSPAQREQLLDEPEVLVVSRDPIRITVLGLEISYDRFGISVES